MNKNAFTLSKLYVCFGACMYTNIKKKQQKNQILDGKTCDSKPLQVYIFEL